MRSSLTCEVGYVPGTVTACDSHFKVSMSLTKDKYRIVHVVALRACTIHK